MYVAVMYVRDSVDLETWEENEKILSFPPLILSIYGSMDYPRPALDYIFLLSKYMKLPVVMWGLPIPRQVNSMTGHSCEPCHAHPHIIT